MPKGEAKEKIMANKYCLLLLVFLVIGSAVYAESFMLLGNSVYYEFIGNAVGQGGTKAIALQNLLESERRRYENANAESNEIYIKEIVRRHTIRKGDIYFISVPFARLGLTIVGIVEFTSDTQYTYWFYRFQGMP